MRKKWVIIIAAALLAALSLLFCSCNGTPNGEEIPVVDWTDYLYDVATAFDAQFLKVDTNDPVVCDFNIHTTEVDSGYSYECVAKLNLDFCNKSSQKGVFRIERVEGDERKAVLQIYNEDDLLYLQTYDEESRQQVYTCFDNAPLLYSLTKLTGLFGEDLDYSTMGMAFIFLGRLFFTDAVANADHSVYTFDFDLKKGLANEITRDTFAKLPELLQKLFFSVAKVGNYEDMFSRTPSVKGKINVCIQDGKLESIGSDDLVLQDNDVSKNFKFNMSRIIVANGEDNTVEDYRPDDKDFAQGRLSEITSVGVVKLEDTNLGCVEMQYDYEFRAKLDILELIAEDGDLTKLDDDNFFHMRVLHTCNSQCGAFCKDKYDSAKGAIFDVAFSPKDFGTYDVYISIGVRALIGNRVTSQIFSFPDVLLNTQIPEYWLSVISAQTLKRQISKSLSQEQQERDKSFLEELLLSLVFNDDGLSAPIEKVLQIMGMSSEEVNSFMCVFVCDDYKIDNLTVEQTYFRRSVSPYDVKRSAIHLYGNDVPGTKQYTKGFISRPPALTYQYNSQAVSDGANSYDVVTLRNDEYVDGVLLDANTSFSADEIEKITGSYVYAQAIDIYGESFDTQLYVVGYSPIDLYDEGWQKIELYCMPTGRGYVDGMLWEEIRDYNWSRWLCKTITTSVKLEKVKDIVYVASQKSNYMQGEKLSAGDTPERILATINYDSGNSKSIYVDSANSKELLITDSAGNRFIGSGRDTVLQFYLFGKYYGQLIKVSPAKDVSLNTTVQELSLEQSDVGYSSQLRVGRLEFILADDSVNQLTLPGDYIRINGYSIGEVNEYFYVNLTSLSGSVIFKNTGRYTLTFVYGNIEKSIPLYIVPKSEKRDESKYNIENTTNSNSHYFEGYTYAFSAQISNSYHGEWGITSTVSVQILKGYISSYGSLLYQEPTDGESYFDITEIRIDNQLVDNDYSIELPPTIYKEITVRTRVQFLESGYYKVRIKLGSSYCEQEIFVENTF